MSPHRRRARGDQPVVRRELIEHQVDDLLAIAAGMVDPQHGDARTERYDAGDLLRSQLLDALEEEVVPAVIAEEHAAVLKDEVRREVAKKALVGLRLDALKRLAEQRSLAKSGNREDLAERLAHAYGYDDEAIARLVIDNEDEPRPERGTATRLFALQRAVAAKSATARLDELTGHYIRVGVARWFVFDDYTADEEILTVAGRLLSYKPFVDETGAEVSLGSTTSTQHVRARLQGGRHDLRVDHATATTARAAAKAIAAALAIPLRPNLPARPVLTGHAANVEPRAALLLDLLLSRVTAAGVSRRNLTVVRFEIDRDIDSAPEEAESTSLRAVRFEGHHLLWSQQACSLIAVEIRPLVEASLWGQVDNDGEPVWLPIKVTVANDHLAVLTGYGRQEPELSVRVHRALVDQAAAGMIDGLANPQALDALIQRISERAAGGDPATDAPL